MNDNVKYVKRILDKYYFWYTIKYHKQYLEINVSHYINRLDDAIRKLLSNLWRDTILIDLITELS